MAQGLTDQTPEVGARTLAQVRAAVEASGLDAASMGWGDGSRDHHWTVRLAEDSLLLGGSDHGTWMTWREFDQSDTEGVVAALWAARRLPAPAAIPRTLAETAQAADLGVEMMDRAAAWAAGDADSSLVNVLPASEIKVGTPLDHVGNASGHILHHFGTPWERRVMTSDVRSEPVQGYLLVHVLPVACRAERVTTSHGEPGGAWRVVLDRPIADYVLSGALRPFMTKDAASA